MPHIVPRSAFTSALAHATLAGELSADSIVERCAKLIGKRWRWLRPLANRFVIAFQDKPRPRHREVVRFINTDAHYQNALNRYGPALQLERRLLPEPKMRPVAAAANWNLPVLESIGDLALWLRLDPAELLWLADLKALARKNKNPQLRHYHYRALTKKSGSVRLIEAPKQHLKQIQRQILAEILNRVPAHPAAHGFVPGRSIQTFAAPHVHPHIVLRMDLQDFFPSISGPRVQAAFRTAGYPEQVADLLGGLCSTSTPHDIWQSTEGLGLSASTLFALRSLYARPHLPQGSPASPALANLCAYRVDCRLAGLARSANAQYTRYGDDLAFSGDQHFAASIDSFAARTAAILLEEGFQVHYRKTRIMRQGTRQHLAGLVVNQHLNTPRVEFDRLRAILTNCARSGPQGQNHGNHSAFQAHLAGRIGFVESVNSARGARLRKIFARISWPSPDTADLAFES